MPQEPDGKGPGLLGYGCSLMSTNTTFAGPKGPEFEITPVSGSFGTSIPTAVNARSSAVAASFVRVVACLSMSTLVPNPHPIVSRTGAPNMCHPGLSKSSPSNTGFNVLTNCATSLSPKKPSESEQYRIWNICRLKGAIMAWNFSRFSSSTWERISCFFTRTDIRSSWPFRDATLVSTCFRSNTALAAEPSARAADFLASPACLTASTTDSWASVRIALLRLSNRSLQVLTALSNMNSPTTPTTIMSHPANPATSTHFGISGRCILNGPNFSQS